MTYKDPTARALRWAIDKAEDKFHETVYPAAGQMYRLEAEENLRLLKQMLVEVENTGWRQRTDDPFDQWMAAMAFVKPGQRLFVDRGGSKWYANIRHEKGYVVWYMPGGSPSEALAELARALEERGEPKFEVLGEWQRVSA